MDIDEYKQQCLPKATLEGKSGDIDTLLMEWAVEHGHGEFASGGEFTEEDSLSYILYGEAGSDMLTLFLQGTVTNAGILEISDVSLYDGHPVQKRIAIPDPAPPRLVACAAIRHRVTGEIRCGPRHHWIIHRLGIDAPPWKGNIDQGFVDFRGEFLTREEAWAIAEREGQLRRRTGSTGTLYSEDLG